MKLSEKMEKKVASWAALSEDSHLNQKPVVILIRQWVSDAQKLEGSLEHVRGELEQVRSRADGLADDERTELARLKEYNLTLVATRDQARADRSAALKSVEEMEKEVERLLASLDQAARDRDEALTRMAALEGANDSLSWVIEKFIKGSDPE